MSIPSAHRFGWFDRLSFVTGLPYTFLYGGFMRQALILLLMIPWAVGCDDGGKQKPADTANADNDANSDPYAESDDETGPDQDDDPADDDPADDEPANDEPADDEPADDDPADDDPDDDDPDEDPIDDDEDPIDDDGADDDTESIECGGSDPSAGSGCERTCPGGMVTTSSELDAFEGCTHIGSMLYLNGLTGADNVDALHALTRIDGALYIQSTAVENLDGLRNLNAIENLTITGNASLSGISGLSGLRSVTNVEITENASLSTLTGLEGITEVTWLTLFENPALVDVDGLINLRHVTDSILIGDNDALQNLDGLGSVSPDGESIVVHITDNDVLCESDAWSFVEMLRERGATVETSFDGVDYMHGNDDC